MSDTRPNDGNTTPDTDAADTTAADASAADAGSGRTAYREPDAVDFDAAAAAEATNRANAGHLASERSSDQAEPTGFTGTGSHAALPVSTPATSSYLSDDYAATAAIPSDRAAAAEATTDYQPQYTPEPATDYVPPYAPAAQTPIYVQAPTPPRNRGNRGSGIAIAVLATLVYAVLYSLVVFFIAGAASTSVANAVNTFAEFAVQPVFYVPIIFFFIAFALLITLANRAGWWAYVLFGFLVGAVVYFSYIGGALLTVQVWNLTAADALRFVGSQWLNPGAIAAAIIAREVPIWAGAWIARRGRRVSARNLESRQEYERQLAEGPQFAR